MATDFCRYPAIREIGDYFFVTGNYRSYFDCLPAYSHHGGVKLLRQILLLSCALLVPAFAQTNLNAPRLFELGMDALTGIGPGRDTTSAMDYFRKSADLGYPPAQISLGYYYEVGGLIAADRRRLSSGTRRPPSRTTASGIGS